MATTQANVLLIAPELIGIDQDIWDLILADVNRHVSSVTFGEFTEEACRYLAAHYLTLQSDKSINSASGALVKDKVGDVFREYSRSSNERYSEADYNRTGYGKTFLSIRRKVAIKFKAYVPDR